MEFIGIFRLNRQKKFEKFRIQRIGDLNKQRLLHNFEITKIFGGTNC